MLIHTVYMALDFKSGTQPGCSNWDPNSNVRADELVGSKDCKLDGENTSDQILAFAPGERINLTFGTVSSVTFDFIDNTAGGMSGANVLMNTDGQIAIGNWQANFINADNSGAASSAKQTLIGRYYLDGNTIAIATSDGSIHHSFIGFSKKDGKNIVHCI